MFFEDIKIVLWKPNLKVHDYHWVSETPINYEYKILLYIRSLKVGNTYGVVMVKIINDPYGLYHHKNGGPLATLVDYTLRSRAQRSVSQILTSEFDLSSQDFVGKKLK